MSLEMRAILPDQLKHRKRGLLFYSSSNILAHELEISNALVQRDILEDLVLMVKRDKGFSWGYVLNEAIDNFVIDNQALYQCHMVGWGL